MIHAKTTFTTQIVFMGMVEELPSVEDVLRMIQNGEVDVEYIETQNTIGHNFVIIVKPKGQQPEQMQIDGDIPF